MLLCKYTYRFSAASSTAQILSMSSPEPSHSMNDSFKAGLLAKILPMCQKANEVFISPCTEDGMYLYSAYLGVYPNVFSFCESASSK